MSLAEGIKLGSYEILAPLGAGGMGEVYRARDTKLEREVAIKVLPATVANDPDTLARFEREAKAVAALSHPNILAIHDFGSQDGIAYAVTELLDGDTLRGKLDAGPLAQRQAIDWALQIAKGLSAAHEKGIVHRDLKPENVFVTKAGHVKILDFGLAKRVEAASPESKTSAPTGSDHTAPGTVLGTLGYMSPEQVKGQAVDHRSDIFSLGAVLYEMLSGKRAFKRNTGAETIAAILTQEPPELTESGRNVSPALDHVVRHCLEKEPANRFGTANDVAFALSEASGSTTVTSGAQPGPPAPRGRRRLWIAVAAIVVLAAAGVFLAKRARTTGSSARGVKRIAVLPFENEGTPDDDYFADGIADEVRAKLTSLPGLEVIARGSSTPYKKTTKTPKQIADELNASYLLTATVRWQKGDGPSRVHVTPELIEVKESAAPASKWQQPFDAALTDVFQVQSDIAARVAQALGVALGAGEETQLAGRPTKSLPAYDAFLKGEQADDALARNDPPRVRKALAFYEQAVALDPGFAQAWARVSHMNSILYSNSTPSPEFSDRARQAAEKAVALAPKDANSYRAMGSYKRLVLRDYRGAREDYAKAKSLAPGNAELIRALGTVEVGLGQMDAALAQFREAQRLDPRSTLAYDWLGSTLLALRRYPEARQAIDAGLVLSPDNFSLIEDRITSSLGEGNLPAARAFLAALPGSVEPTELVAYLANFQDLGWVLTDDQQDVLMRLTPAAFDGDRSTWGLCLAQVLWWKGDVAGARKYADEARQSLEDQVRAAPNDPGRLASLGLALAYLGRGEEAIRKGQRAVEIDSVKDDATNGPYALQQLARIYALAGQQDKAIDTLEQMLAVPYYVSRDWLKIDPNFDPLRNNPRFQKLVAGAK